VSRSAGWWEDAFGSTYLDVYSHRDDESARRETAFAASALQLVGAARVLDAGCGAGRHARALAAAGFSVVGLDRSADLLSAAWRRSGGPRSGVRYVRGDLRALPFRSGVFAATVSFFTSFGYFDDAGDRTQLREVRRVLRPGGRHFLDFLNAPRVVADLVPESSRIVASSGSRAATTVREVREVRAGRVEKSVEVVDPSGTVRRWRESVRLWSRAEIEAMLADAGLCVRAVHGDLSGGPWTPDAPRLVIVSEAV